MLRRVFLLVLVTCVLGAPATLTRAESAAPALDIRRIQAIKEKGEVYGPIPYGWRKEGDKLVPNMYERDLQSLAQKLRDENHTWQWIADEFNDLGHKTKNGGKWYPQTIKNLIRGAL